MSHAKVSKSQPCTADDGELTARYDRKRAFRYNPAPLYMLDLVTGIKLKLHDDAIAFFWSPDSLHLAVYSITLDGLRTTLGAHGGALYRLAGQSQTASPLLRIESVNVTNGEALLIADTLPASTLVSVLSYFDQYAHALTPWSPDGRQFVFTSASPTTDTIDLAVATFDAAGTQVQLKRIGEGVVAPLVGWQGNRI